MISRLKKFFHRCLKKATIRRKSPETDPETEDLDEGPSFPIPIISPIAIFPMTAPMFVTQDFVDSIDDDNDEDEDEDEYSG